MRILFALSCALLLAGVVAADQLVWGVPEAQVITDNSVLIEDLPAPTDAGTQNEVFQYLPEDANDPPVNYETGNTIDNPVLLKRVRDGKSPFDCAGGEGVFDVMCQDNETTWEPIHDLIVTACQGRADFSRNSGTQCCGRVRAGCRAVLDVRNIESVGRDCSERFREHEVFVAICGGGE